MGPFNSFAANVYSQNGEDGILAEIIGRLYPANSEHWCVEFGAWDGKHLSNTFALVERGWRAVYIESDPTKYRDLLQTASQWKSIVPVQAFVSEKSDDPSGLDAILAGTPVPLRFSLLSIDIDSFDADVWENTTRYGADLVVIEINSAIRPGPELRHAQSGNGNSFSAVLKIGQAKGYTLLCHTGNLIFVRTELVDRLGMAPSAFSFPPALFIPDWADRAEQPPPSLVTRAIKKLSRVLKGLG